MSVCLCVHHYYSGKFACTINTIRHFGFESRLVMHYMHFVMFYIWRIFNVVNLYLSA